MSPGSPSTPIADITSAAIKRFREHQRKELQIEGAGEEPAPRKTPAN